MFNDDQATQPVQNNKLYVGNLPWSVDTDKLIEIFSDFGQIDESGTIVIVDKMSGRSKGFGFVQFVEESHAQDALEAMNGYEIEGRELKVTIARPKQPRSNFNDRRGGGGYNRGGGSRGGYNRGGNSGGGYGRNNDSRGSY